ncbi:MAG: preprotein translocase subunit SecG [Anaeroplasmataceae bacterium]
MNVVDIFIIIFAILLIIIVMMQESKDNINDAFSGQKTELFKNQKTRGIELFFQRATAAIAVIFFVLIIVRAII